MKEKIQISHICSKKAIPFNLPYVNGRELGLIQEALDSRKLSGDGPFTKKAQAYFEQNYHFSRALLTTSCTDALEMAAILVDIKPGDEVILPSYTFVSTANAFVLRGAKLVFADSLNTQPNIDHNKLAELITPRTKGIVVVHYAGVACEMDTILQLAQVHGLFVIEDAAQAIDSFYKGKPLGGIGDFGTFSFHETKNIICGEGGLLAVNNPDLVARAEIIREKGTNRTAFFRGEVDKYGWVDIGSSFLPSEMTAAYLYAQLETLDAIQNRRKAIWQRYYENLKHLMQRDIGVSLPVIPDYATNNAHMFYMVCRDLDQRTDLIAYLKKYQVHSVFHYLSLHSSPYFSEAHDGRVLPESDRYTNCIVRLPLYYELEMKQVDFICELIVTFFLQ